MHVPAHPTLELIVTNSSDQTQLAQMIQAMAAEAEIEVKLVTMEFAMDYVVRAHVYTGSMLYLYIATLVLTIPLAWLLHRFTRVRESTTASGGR